MEQEYILIIGLIKEGTEFLIARELGYKTIVFNRKLSLKEAMNADVPVELCLNCEKTVLSKAKEYQSKYNIKAVFTLNEYRVPLAAKVREELGIGRGISYDAANSCRSKRVTREKLLKLGEQAVKYYLIDDETQLPNTVNKLGYPVVVKPSNDAGSNNVFCCKSENEVINAYRTIIKESENSVGQKLEKKVLVEEFLDGPEYSVESYTQNGVTNVIAITAKKIISPFYPVEKGHTVPALLDEREENNIKQLVEKTLEILGVDDSVTHTEVKYTSDGPKIVEVNARPGGDKIPALVKAVTGYDLHKIAMQLNLGETIEEVGYCKCRPKKADIRFFVAPYNGKVEYKKMCSLKKDVKIKNLELKVEDGAYVEKTTSNYNRLGCFVIFDEDDAKIEEYERCMRVTKSTCCS